MIQSQTFDNISYHFPTSSKAFQRALSSLFPKGSRLYRTDAENKTGSWGIIEIFFRKSCNPTDFVSTSSIRISPSIGANLNRAAINDDFPAPVLPTIPT